MPLHYTKAFAAIALLTILAFILWLLWGALFEGATVNEPAAHLEQGGPSLALARAN